MRKLYSSIYYFRSDKTFKKKYSNQSISNCVVFCVLFSLHIIYINFLFEYQISINGTLQINFKFSNHIRSFPFEIDISHIHSKYPYVHENLCILEKLINKFKRKRNFHIRTHKDP